MTFSILIHWKTQERQMKPKQSNSKQDARNPYFVVAWEILMKEKQDIWFITSFFNNSFHRTEERYCTNT